MNKPPVRRGVAQDCESIRALTRRAYAKWIPLIGREPLPMSADYGAAVRDHIFGLIEDRGTLIALIEMICQPDHLLIENVAVDPDRQGQGLGRHLIAYSEEVAKEHGYRILKLYTNAVFETNVALYQKLGFGVEREEEFLGGVCVHMQKAL